MPIAIVPTPIGNLEDITLRALCALRTADLVACEDTRRTVKLMNHYDIKKPLISCRSGNERTVAQDLVTRALAGERIALVSDAGTPGISDPGAGVIAEAIARGAEIDVLPGPVAFVPALLLSGLPARRFVFVGFLGDKRSEREAAVREVASLQHTLIFYSAPHDLERDLLLLLAELGDRRAAVVREISKVHQQTMRGALSELADLCGREPPRGEIVLVVDGAAEPSAPDDWTERALEMKHDGASDRDIADAMLELYRVPRNTTKKFLIGAV